MKKIKIAYYADVKLDGNDGPAVNESEFLRNLYEYAKDDFLFITSMQNNLFCIQNNIKNVIYIQNFRFRFFLSFFISSLINIKKIKHQKADILVCRLSDMPLIPFLYKLIYRREKLAIKTAAFWYIDQGKSKKLFSKIYQIVNNFITKKTYQLADIVDTALPDSINSFVSHGIVCKDKIKVIDNGINVSKFCIRTDAVEIAFLKESFPILGFMGSYPSSRGAKQALEVAQRLKSFYPKVAVLILGYDDELEKLISFYKDYGISIYAPGIVPYSSIEQYVQSMTIGFSFYESWTVSFHGNASQKVRQYLACGKPVFSTHHNHGFLIDNDIGAIFKDDDYEMMAKEAIKWLERVKEEKILLENRIRKYAVDNLSCEHTFAQRVELYQNIVNHEKNDTTR